MFRLKRKEENELNLCLDIVCVSESKILRNPFPLVSCESADGESEWKGDLLTAGAASPDCSPESA